MRGRAIPIALSVLMVVSAAAAWLKEELKPWKRYQSRYHQTIRAQLKEGELRISRPERSPLEGKIEMVAGGRKLIIQFRNEKGESERCLTCHLGLEEISPNHPVERAGCVACHGGDRLALEVKAAHKGLVRSDEKSCGGSSCHGDMPGSIKHRGVKRCFECHYDLSDSGRYEGNDAAMRDSKDGIGRKHRITTAIPSFRCLRCHSSPSEEHRRSPRCVERLGCINCHLGDEVMLGRKRSITCSTCHSPKFKTITSREDPAVRFSRLNPFISNAVGDVMATDDSGRKLPNVKRIGDRVILIDKSTGQRYKVPIHIRR
ncbi:TPA: hypothetical protein EYP37_00825 [Candidatus Poribacteria bacterium]|nr:hypothetical protein [Candidatus Poribacteria bacterium]